MSVGVEQPSTMNNVPLNEFFSPVLYRNHDKESVLGHNRAISALRGLMRPGKRSKLFQ